MNRMTLTSVYMIRNDVPRFPYVRSPPPPTPLHARHYHACFVQHPPPSTTLLVVTRPFVTRNIYLFVGLLPGDWGRLAPCT
jgi:hypothetical protein